MKKVICVLLLVFLYVPSVANAKTNWNFFVPIGPIAPPPSPAVVIVNPQPQQPQINVDQTSNYNFIGTVTAIEGNAITVQDQRGATSTFKTSSATRNLMGKSIEVNDEVEIIPTGPRFDIIDSIRLVAPVGATVSGGDVESRLKKAKSLLEQGLITEEEYKAARQRILNDL